MPLFSRFKNKGAQPATKSKTQPDLTNGRPAAPQKPRVEVSWNSKTVDPDDVVELIHLCTAEMKSRGESVVSVSGVLTILIQRSRSTRFAVPPSTLSTQL